MSTTAYVGQGSIRIRAKNIEALHKHLNSLGEEFESSDFETTCSNFGIEVSFENGNDINDAFPNSSSWSEDYEGRFYKEIALFVESGSYQTFYCEGHMFAYIYGYGAVSEVSLDDVAKGMAGMVEEMVMCSNFKCRKNIPMSKLLYRWPDPKVVELVSPGDTVPLGICPACNSAVYQNEEK